MVITMVSSGMRHDQTRSTVLRAVMLLECFTFDDDELSLDELASRSGLPRTTTYRISLDLVESGVLEKGRKGYRLGRKLFEFGQRVPMHRQLREVALPFLQDLHQATGMTVNLAVRDGLEIVYVEKLIQRGTAVPHTRSGGRLPAHCTGLGKAILAFSPAVVSEQMLTGYLEALTEHTRTKPADLRRELAEVRRSRVAFDNQESRLGLFCVAAPILLSHGVAGAISVTGATGADQARSLSTAVLTVAHAISRSLESPGPAMRAFL